ncbi:hypothetical protein TWF481_009212 [Arthrobotrys musiformis]|uniref:Nucleoside phosphorylase domain-containing protein n=1 Tax=Arthrobotrys musiformis TaxID=47236 RepID=A0AAV9W530_9PEZI
MPKRNREDEESLGSCSEYGTPSKRHQSYDIDAEGEEAFPRVPPQFGYETVPPSPASGLPPSTTNPTKSLPCSAYTIGWLSALPIEMAAAAAMLQEIHISRDIEKHLSDNNTYTLGEIGGHNIVIACLPSGVYGTTSATTVANQMTMTFTSIKSWLMVGIGGGVPDATNDIRLGDIVVSRTVIQYDYGKTVAEGRFERTGTLNKPSASLLTAIAKLQADHERAPSQIPVFLSEMLHRNPHMGTNYKHQGRENDMLFDAGYGHSAFLDTCEFCSKERLVSRLPRTETRPMIFYGSIASANQVMKDAKTRDQLRQELGILCFEMEAAGLMDNFPCLVIRGICDYADSHKNKQWQQYSAATAAAYAKELLLAMPAAIPNREIPMVRPAVKAKTMEERTELMEALKFDQIETRKVTIKNAHRQTCKWLLTKPEYRNWLDESQIPEHHGFLWIKGKPGTGKSTIMKFALKDCEKKLEGCFIISFFFNARGGDLEKSTIGMYRSLLYQLLERFPELQVIFDSLDSPKTTVGDDPWNLDVLKDLFRRALRQLGKGSLVCFIDALDECEEDQIRDMLDFFDDLGTLAISLKIRLHVCLSSRHYPHITIRNGQQMVLEGQEGHDHDIASYLRSELRAGNGKQSDEIRNEILEKASGVFLWVVLVVQILNKEYDRGRLHALRKRLKEIPPGLSDLFKDILTRDTENMETLLLCLEWVLYAERPLKLVELYFAILSGESPEDLGVWDPEEITEEVMRRYVLSSSKGLAETTKSSKGVAKPTDQTIQFIHESVRDYLLKENGLAELRAEFGSGLDSHERLKQCCRNYYTNIVLPQDPRLKEIFPSTPLKESSPTREFVTGIFPFLEYAVPHLLYHAEAASNNGSSQEDFIENFHLETWIKLNNLVEKFQVRRYRVDTSLLYIFAEQGFRNLVRIEVKRVNNIDLRGGRYSYPIVAALANGHEEAVKELLRSDINTTSPIVMPRDQDCENVKKLLADGRNFKVPKRQTFLSYAVERREWDWVKVLLATKKVDLKPSFKLREYIQENWTTTHSLLSAAAYDGSTLVVGLLLAEGVRVDEDYYGSPLHWAVFAGHEAVVALLLENGASIDIKSASGRTPLSYAASRGHEAVVDILLKNGPNVKSKDAEGRTPLFYAAKAGYEAILNKLLERGAQVGIQDKLKRTPLSYAAEGGYEAIVEKLLKKGADVGSEDIDGRTPLFYAARAGYEKILDILLERGAQVDVRDRVGRTPLSYAASAGYEAIVNILLKNGADDKLKRTPLSYAAGGGHEKIINILLERGVQVDVNIRDKSRRTALWYAADGGHEGIVDLLLKNGADLRPKDVEGRTVLLHSAARGKETILNKLLEKCAQVDVNARDKLGWTVLWHAATRGFEAVFDKLLEDGAGVDVGHRDVDGRTLLSHAAAGGNEAILYKLLERGARVDINARDNSGRTALSYAAGGGHEAVFDRLLENDAEMDAERRDAGGRTLLSRAADGGNEVILKKLLERGAQVNVNVRDNSGGTPLSYAAGGGHEAVFDRLLEHGAEVDSDNDGETPLSRAAAVGCVAILKKLLENGNNAHIDPERPTDSRWDWNSTPLIRAATGGHEAAVALLLENGAKLSRTDTWGTPLSLAAEGGHTGTVKLLLDNGHEVDAGGRGKDTPLMGAASKGHLPAVALLLERGAALESEGGSGQTALLWASMKGHGQVTKLLLEKGANTESKGFLGMTSLMWATENGHLEIVRQLLESGADPLAKDDRNRTALTYATDYKKLEVERLLSDHLRSWRGAPISRSMAAG